MRRVIPQPAQGQARKPIYINRSAHARWGGVYHRRDVFVADGEGGARRITLHATGRRFEHYFDPAAPRWRPGDAMPEGAHDALGALIRHAKDAEREKVRRVRRAA